MLLVLFLLMTSPTDAYTSEEVPFFRTIDAEFPSGWANAEALLKAPFEKNTRTWYQIKTSQAQGWIKPGQFFAARELIQSNQEGQTYYGLVKETTALHSAPSSESKHIRKLKKNERVEFKLLNSPNTLSWIQIRSSGQTGFVRLSSLITPFEFATHVKLKNSQEWTPVLYFAHNEWSTFKNTRIKISEISEVQIPEQKIVLQTSLIFTRPSLSAKTIKISQHDSANLISEKAISWQMSWLKEHGRIWWETDSLQTLGPTVIKKEDLYARRIFDMATSPIKSDFRVISANGIYTTDNNTDFIKLSHFKDQNHPIAFGAGGQLFVGKFMSQDNAATFQTYLKWESIIKLLGKHQIYSPNKIRVSDIYPHPQNSNSLKVKLSVNRSQYVYLETDDLGQSWRILK